jgi:hypothetical protein
MFTRLAKFRRIGLRHVVPVLCDVMHSNDSLPGFRRPAATGKRRSPSPALACHWFDRNGRLECRWLAETNDDAPLGEVDEHEQPTIGRTSGQPSMQPRGHGLVLAG